MDVKGKPVAYIGPHPDASDPRLALRGRANLAVRVTPSGWLKWRCPYCGSKTKVKLRPRNYAGVHLLHEPWCPVPLDEEVLR